VAPGQQLNFFDDLDGHEQVVACSDERSGLRAFIAIHSTAALSIDDPDTSKRALGVIRENSVAGLAEMRRLIGILRERGGDLEPAAAPTLDGLGACGGGAHADGEHVLVDRIAERTALVAGLVHRLTRQEMPG
jgi:acetylornithine deacetylase/succinyl-diaminopimelate desuccinylase-like protein